MRMATEAVRALLAAFVLLAGLAIGDTLDDVPLETRAALAVAATAYPPDVAPALQPNSAEFDPSSAPDYLLEYGAGQEYGVQYNEGDAKVTIELHQFPDKDAAAAAFSDWVSESHNSGNNPRTLVWPEFDHNVMTRGGGILGVAGSGMGSEVLGQKDRWHFRIRVSGSQDDLVEARRQYTKLQENARKYRLFDGYELRLHYSIDDAEWAPLQPGKPFRLALNDLRETNLRLRAEVIGPDGAGVENVDWRVELKGNLAPHASSASGGALVEEQARDAEPLDVVWTFPDLTDASLLKTLESGDEDGISINVQAKFRSVNR